MMEKALNDKVVFISAKDIKPYGGSHNTDAVVEMLRESITQFGIQQPLILDSRNNVVAGNALYKAAVLNGIETLPCIVLDNLTDDEIAQYRIADNKTSEFARWNEKKLRKELSYLQSPDELQFCFDENIKNMLGLNEPLKIHPSQPNKEEHEKPKEVSRQEVETKFKEELKRVDKELEAKPREYFEYVCSKCHKTVTIKV